jgi:hypothetical protein
MIYEIESYLPYHLHKRQMMRARAEEENEREGKNHGIQVQKSAAQEGAAQARAGSAERRR